MFLKDITRHVEAIIFASEQPVGVSEITQSLSKSFETEFAEDLIAPVLESLKLKYHDDIYPFEIIESGGGYQFLTKGDYHETVSVFLNRKTSRRLSVIALETLAIIAYKQPVTKPEIEKIRGVNCDYTVQKLMEKELIEITGRSDEPGKPLLYGTSRFFMDYFGINDLGDLPKLKEFEELESQVGEKKD
jgi:segregation and condensation protein B